MEVEFVYLKSCYLAIVSMLYRQIEIWLVFTFEEIYRGSYIIYYFLLDNNCMWYPIAYNLSIREGAISSKYFHF